MFSRGQTIQDSSSDASNGHAISPTPLLLVTSASDASSRQQTPTGAETTFPPQPVESLPDGIATLSRGPPPKSFVSRLYNLVNDPTNWEVIRWAEDGNGFVILNQDKFSKEIMGAVFKHNNIASFIRQLSMYDFYERSKRENGARFFQHQDGLFSRGHRDILDNIKRKGFDTDNGHAMSSTTKASLAAKRRRRVVASHDLGTAHGLSPLEAPNGVPVDYSCPPVTAPDPDSPSAPGGYHSQHSRSRSDSGIGASNYLTHSYNPFLNRIPDNLFDNQPTTWDWLINAMSPEPTDPHPPKSVPSNDRLQPIARTDAVDRLALQVSPLSEAGSTPRSPTFGRRNWEINSTPPPPNNTVPVDADDAAISVSSYSNRQQAQPIERTDVADKREPQIAHLSEATSSQDGALVHSLDGHRIVRESHTPFNTSGAFCDVFVGSHPVYNRVVMKRPRMTMGGSKGSSMKHFRAEAEIWSKLWHPNILRFIGMIEAENYVWLISPFAANGSLPDYIEARPETDREKLVRQLIQAIEYLHGQKIVHGDIKGANILISESVDVLLCDFGLAKYQDMKTATSLKGAGTWYWSAPELLLEDEVSKTTASDVYAFGMTIYQILSGNIPFGGCSLPALVRAISSNKRPPKEPVASLSGRSYALLWEIAEACWVAEAKDRPTMSSIQAHFSLGPASPFGMASWTTSYSGQRQSRPIKGTAFSPSDQNEEMEGGVPGAQSFVGLGAYRTQADTPFHDGFQENLFTTHPTISTVPSSSYDAFHVSLPPLSPVISLVGSTENTDGTTSQALTSSSRNGPDLTIHTALQDSIWREISSIGQGPLRESSQEGLPPPSLPPGFSA